MGDVERILTRIALKSARPRDLLQLRNSLALLPQIKDLLSPLETPLLQTLSSQMKEFPAMVNLLTRSITEDVPVTIRDGSVIAPGYDQQLDELRALSEDASSFLHDLEHKERERTGLSSLKVGYNRVHGYYIEISRTQSEMAPADYTRRQTLKSTERFIIPELKAFEDKILSAREKALAREKQLYDELLGRLTEELANMQHSIDQVAEIDVLVSFAERAVTLELSAPKFTDEPFLSITGGRHLVVEQVQNEPFIANDLQLDSDQQMLIITGPNMGGKSTFMRQTALIVILAHIGSFIPAESATIGPVDRIFTRIGAADDLAGGKSTFMVEMIETANILNNATASSLILMDEIGRGTGTTDGLALAWSSAEYLATRIRGMTLFATHYFELTGLPEKLDNVSNVHLDAVEHGDEIIFMHAVKPGPTNRSYGIQVARLAGIPPKVLDHARAFLQAMDERPVKPDQDAEGDLFKMNQSRLVDTLNSIEPDELTPRDALDLIYRLKSELD